MRPRFDDRDARIVAERCAKWEQRDGPRVGDFCQLKDGSLRRVAETYGDVLQLADQAREGHFYLGEQSMRFAGRFGEAMPTGSFMRMPFSRKGRCWIYHHNRPEKSDPVDTEVNCRVYMEV